MADQNHTRTSEGELRVMSLTDGYTLKIPKSSNWKCHMFGSRPDGFGMVYTPSEGNVPNAFVRWMMKVCFACTWIYTEPASEENLND